MKYIITAIIALYGTITLAQEEIIFTADTIVVTASRIPIEINQSSRNVLSIKAEELKNRGIENIDEALVYFGIIDLQSRQNNVQSDISLRGTTFEQTVVMIDGVAFNNPQTGHHNSNIPLTLNDIERIEVMPGHSSSLYGSYGFGGSINFITKNSFSEKMNYSSKLRYGSFNSTLISAGGNLSTKDLNINFNVEKDKSDGFIKHRDYEGFKANLSLTYSLAEEENIKAYYGHLNRDFGAYDFYTPGRNYPSAETIKNDIFLLKLTKKWNDFFFQPSLYYNKTFDDFIISRDHPEWYQAVNDVYKYGGDLVIGYSFSKNLYITSFLGKGEEKIEGSQIKNHDRDNIYWGNEVLLNMNKFGVNFSLRNDYYSNKENVHSPGMGCYFWLNTNIKLRGSYGFSYRRPSFTELYYNDPGNVGNENLRSEKNYSYEVGIDGFGKLFQIRNTFFYRNEHNLIDWEELTKTTINDTTTKWYANNISNMKFWGIETELSYSIFENFNITLKNLYVYSKSKKNYTSKYGLNYTKNQSSLMFSFPLAYKSKGNILVTYKNKERDEYFITSAFIKSNISSYTSLFFKIKNIFNKQYEEITGIPQPGREFQIGIDIGN